MVIRHLELVTQQSAVEKECATADGPRLPEAAGIWKILSTHNTSALIPTREDRNTPPEMSLGFAKAGTLLGRSGLSIRPFHSRRICIMIQPSNNWSISIFSRQAVTINDRNLQGKPDHNGRTCVYTILNTGFTG